MPENRSSTNLNYTKHRRLLVITAVSYNADTSKLEEMESEIKRKRNKLRGR
jgi:hypothetical protein